MKNIHILFIYIIFSVLFNVTGCSSSGGDSAPAVQPLAYVGNTNPAAITLTNTPTLVVNALYGGAAASGIPTGVSVSANDVKTGSGTAIARSLLSLFHYSTDDLYGNAVNIYNLPSAAAVPINETEYCDTGYFTLVGSIDDSTLTGTLAINYVNCVLEGVTYNGSGTMSIYYFDPYTFAMGATIDFALLSMSGPDFSGRMSGSVTIDSSMFGSYGTETITMNLVAQDDALNKMYKFESYVMSVSINYDYSSSLSINGTIYDSIHGSITVTTILPLSFSSYLNADPDAGGPLIFTGNNSSIRLTVESARHVLLELDLDGDDIYEIVRYVLWQEIDDYTSLDLADSDSDGMHNSWEMLYGLIPNIPDANDDLDNDLQFNIDEYMGGSDPSDPFSQP